MSILILNRDNLLSQHKDKSLSEIFDKSSDFLMVSHAELFYANLVLFVDTNQVLVLRNKSNTVSSGTVIDFKKALELIGCSYFLDVFSAPSLKLKLSKLKFSGRQKLKIIEILTSGRLNLLAKIAEEVEE